jgi:hypothetical protein
MKAKKAQEEFNAAVEKYNRIKKEGITSAEVPQVQEDVNNLKKLIEQYDALAEKYREIKAASMEGDPQLALLDAAEEKTGISTGKLTEDFAKLGIEIDVINGNSDEAKQKLKELTRAMDEASIKTGTQLNDQARDIAQKNAAIQVTNELIRVYNTAKRGSSEWLDAEKKLAEQFPQFSTAAGIKIDAIDKVNKAQEDAVKAEWNVLQAEVAMTKIKVQSLLTEKEAALAAAEADRAALLGPGDARHFAHNGMSDALKQKAQETNNAVIANKKAVDDLKNSETILNELLNSGLNDIPGVMPLDLSGIGEATKTYENEALNSALKIHDHKVKMEQLTKEQKIKDLQDILKAYAKSADERMDLEERIFQVKQEIRDRDLKATEKAIEDEAKKLADRTSNSERWIDREKTAGNLNGQEEIDAYNRIIKYHKEY